MNQVTRHKAFSVARGASIITSVAGVMIAWAADSVVDTKLMTIQLIVGLIVFAAGCGYYMAFRYMELYWMERERKVRRYGKYQSEPDRCNDYRA